MSTAAILRPLAMSFAFKWSQIMMLPLPNGVVFNAMSNHSVFALLGNPECTQTTKWNATTIGTGMMKGNDISSAATVSIIIILFDQSGVICFCCAWGVREKRYIPNIICMVYV